jgi:hypothetical protein
MCRVPSSGPLGPAHRTRLAVFAAAACAILLGAAPAPASAGFTLTGTPSECVLQQRWESTPAGTQFINLEFSNCRIKASWTHTQEICPLNPPTPPDPVNRDTGRFVFKPYDMTAFSNSGIGVGTGFSNPDGSLAGGTNGYATTSRSSHFVEVQGERLLGMDQWKVIVNCDIGPDVESAAVSIPIILRGPDYKPPSGGGGGQPPPLKPCPAADRLTAESLDWNAHAQKMRGHALAANAEVIRLAEEARNAFIEALGLAGLLNPAKQASKKVVDETISELDRLTEIAAKKRINTAAMDRDEVLTLFRLKKYFERFKAADKALSTIKKRFALAKGLYLLGLAAQKGVERDAHRRQADEALSRSNQLRAESNLAFQRCQAGKAAAARASARAAAAGRPVHARLASPVRPLALSIARRSGVPRAVRTALNSLMAGECRANALEVAMAETLRRAKLARAAGARSWESKQLAHARSLAARVATLLKSQARLRARLVRSLPAALRSNTRLRVSDAPGLAAALDDVPLPSPARQLLKLLRLPPQPFDRGWRTAPTSGELVSRSLASIVGDAATIARDRSRAADWGRFAAGF